MNYHHWAICIYLNKHSKEDLLWLSSWFLLLRKFDLKYISPYSQLLILSNSTSRNHEDLHVFYSQILRNCLMKLIKEIVIETEMGLQGIVSFQELPKRHWHPKRHCQTIPWISWVLVRCADFQGITTTEFSKESNLRIPGREGGKNFCVSLFFLTQLFFKKSYHRVRKVG